ncbi:MAG: CRISPR-associated helicase Cas3' [Candidatus Thermoplasmatota archaeon]|nr:CRISPR-associated helicase Cas3' [Candidatus Thermoplasmatota archaeon]
MNYDEMFKKATGNLEPFPYQRRLATGEDLPQLLDIPTGCGKTAAVVLAWLWRRRFADEEVRKKTPRRLIYCLPMRVLVEQTRDNCIEWLKNLGILAIAHEGNRAPQDDVRPVEGWAAEQGDRGDRIAVTILMGGEDKDEWDMYPERDAIIIGTQDMLLSRALNRGYGMSRYRWPVHYGLLNNDCLWIMDEVQLMGVGVETTSQMDAFRRIIGTTGGCRSIWMSATLDDDRLLTVDQSTSLRKLSLKETNPATEKRTNAPKRVEMATYEEKAIVLDKDSEKGSYYSDIANLIREKHIEDSLTLVVVNTVKRAQEIFKKVKDAFDEEVRIYLLHSRFRESDRKIEALKESGNRIIISTQVVEAGVDISARTLITELAPWSSLVQRFGRCNRTGEYVDANIFWIDMDIEKLAPPYSVKDQEKSRIQMVSLKNATPSELSLIIVDNGEQVRPVIRKKDILELFDTTPDLTGNDLDISRFIRESDEKDVQVYWREIPEDGPSREMRKPHRIELCSAPIGEIKELISKKKDGFRGWQWDHLDEYWKDLGQSSTIIPGRMILLDVDSGGYSKDLGWIGKEWKPKDGKIYEVNLKGDHENESTNSEIETFIGKEVTIHDHCMDVSEKCKSISEKIGLDSFLIDQEALAGLWHDVGKAHEAFQNAIKGGFYTEKLLAKSKEKKNILDYFMMVDGQKEYRRYFRHELASALALLQYKGILKDEKKLAVYLIGAHHGKVRQSIRSLPDETEPEDENLRFARGVWDGDIIPSVDGLFDESISLDLTPMVIGEGSWLEMSLGLLDEYGPFRLAYLESILRISDWLVSRSYEEGVRE